MTDRTQPDSGRIITSSDVIADLQDRIAELESELEAVGAGGVQALSAAPVTPPAEQQATKETSGGFHVWRDISTAPKDGSRFVATGHNYGLYSEVRHTCVAQWFRGCWMEASDWNETSELKYLTHWMPLPSPPDDVAAPAEQQAQPGAVYAELPDSVAWLAEYGGDVFTAAQLLNFAGRTHALRMQAAPKAAQGDAIDEAMRERDDAEDFIDALLDEVLGHERPEWSNLYGRADALNDVQERMTALHKPAVDKAWGQFQSAMAPPQQEAKEPVMIYHGRCTIDCGEHGHHDMEMLRMIPSGSKLYTAPQPAPAPLSDDVVRDAARYRWLRATTNYVTSNGERIDVRNMPEKWDAAIDAAIAAQGGK